MADNPFARMRGRVSGIKEKCTGKIRAVTSRLTPRQRIVLLAILFATFVAVDVVYIVRGFRGGAADGMEIRHLKQVETETLKTNRNDTIPEQGAGQ